MIVAVTSSSNLVRFFTKFTDETFAALVACIFCVESAKKIIMMFFNSNISSTLAMGSAMVALVTCGSAIAISNFKSSPWGPEGVRNLIGDFAPTFAIAIGCRLRAVARGQLRLLLRGAVPPRLPRAFHGAPLGRPTSWLCPTG